MESRFPGEIPHIASDKAINTAGSSVTGIKTSAGTVSTQRDSPTSSLKLTIPVGWPIRRCARQLSGRLVRISQGIVRRAIVVDIPLLLLLIRTVNDAHSSHMKQPFCMIPWVVICRAASFWLVRQCYRSLELVRRTT